MAVLIVKIDTLATLRMNEFFDYAGYCWALSRNRESDTVLAAELEDFYEGTVRSNCMDDIPVIFIYKDQVIGWYKRAEIYRYIRHPSLFLEGNIRAAVRDVRLLKKPAVAKDIEFGSDKNYLVIESGDIRYDRFKSMIDSDEGPFEDIDYAKVKTDTRIRSSSHVIGRRKGRITPADRIENLLNLCEVFASEIMEDRCQGIGTVKGLKELALEATRYRVSSVNAWYYLAMADYQLGFTKKGLRAIDRAIRLEPDGDDLMVMKANLLVSDGCLEEALKYYDEACEIFPDDSYYIMAGRACACMGNSAAADMYYRKVKDSDILKAFGISLSKKRLL